MLLTITTTHHPATDLSFLLHKHPARLQTFGLNFGQVHVFYPEATDERCTAALLLDVDAVGLVRGKKGSSGEGRTLAQYVNDRPYAASSLLSVAIAEVFGSAMAGRSGERPETAAAAIALEATLPVLPCRGGEDVITRLFAPLGYEVESNRLSLDEQFPEWGESGYFHVRLRATVRLADLLSHLYVLIPVLDDEKHYYVGADEVDKLLSRGAGWLSSHPERDLITDRYLSHKRILTRAALERLLEDDADEDEAASGHDAEEAMVEERVNLHTQRHGAVLAVLRETGARRVIDLGCGDGKLLKLLLAERAFTEVAGMDVSHRALEFAARRLHLDTLPPAQRARLNLFQGSLTYRDGRLAGYDAATVVEVIEHLDPPRLAVFERCVFEAAHPASVVVTTPNVEYNVRFPTLPAGTLRHKDHRFEWTRAEFEAWAGTVAGRFGYAVRFLPVGPVDPEVGAPSQMAVFTT
jgi:3' terminal RNA ribose 2'-O-methyltransferase Hen1